VAERLEGRVMRCSDGGTIILLDSRVRVRDGGAIGGGSHHRRGRRSSGTEQYGKVVKQDDGG
jgi:hypothetical protein